MIRVQEKEVAKPAPDSRSAEVPIDGIGDVLERLESCVEAVPVRHAVDDARAEKVHQHRQDGGGLV